MRSVFKRLSISQKLILSFSVCVLSLIIASTATYLLSNLFYWRLEKTYQANDITNDIILLKNNLKSILKLVQDIEPQTELDRIEQIYHVLIQQTQAMTDHVKTDASHDAHLLSYIHETHQLMLEMDKRMQELFSLSAKDMIRDSDPARLQDTLNAILGIIIPQYYEDMVEHLDKATNHLHRFSTGAFESARKYKNVPFWLGGLIVVFFSLLITLLGYFLTRYFQRGMNKLAALTREVSAGNLGYQIEVDTPDEIGRLTTAFNTMSSTLKETTVSKSKLEEKNKALEKLSSLTQENPHPILEVTLDGAVVYLNTAAQQSLWELTHTPLSNHPLFRHILTHLGELPEKKQIIINAVEFESRFYDQMIMLSPDQHSAIIFLTDVTERVAQDRMKDNFVATISHEIRTPIAIVQEGTQSLVQGIAGELTPTQARVAHTMLRNCQRLSKIINNLLDISRFESGKVKLSISRVNLHDLVRQAVDLISIEAVKKSIPIDIDITAHQTHAYVDPDSIMQVLINLLSNALRHAASTIRITLSSTPEYFEISVFNDGRGVHPSLLKSLFHKFEQIHRPFGGDEYKGSGLGLAICKEIVELHGGKIWAGSTLGVDFKVTFQIPIKGA